MTLGISTVVSAVAVVAVTTAAVISREEKSEMKRDSTRTW
jgi:hypothetical protein